MYTPSSEPVQFLPDAEQTSPARTRWLDSLAALALLGLMAALMFASAWDDTITFDEPAHIGAGYSYLRKADYRMNPEHPPLMKDLGALPLLFYNLQEFWDDPTWTGTNQYGFGLKLLYESGGDPDALVRAAKAPMILFTVAFGCVIFWWTRKRFGSGVALLTLFFTRFRPRSWPTDVW